MRVISFNIRNSGDGSPHTVQERQPRLAQTILDEDPDLIGLQELTPPWENWLHDTFADAYDYFFIYRNHTTDIEAAPILWKKDMFSCLKKGNFWLSDTPEEESRGWDERYPCFRMCQYIVLRENASGKIFTFMNTHFGFGDHCQVSSAELMHAYSKKISDHPTFVTGDFNMEPDSAGYGTMTKYFTDANAATTQDWGETFHGYYAENIVPEHIDYCFTDASVKPLGVRRITRDFDGKFPSDHFGLAIELEL